MIDITGQRFGKLVAVEYCGKGRWRCRCDCGGEWIGNGRYLREGDTKSCGCEHYTKQTGPRDNLVGHRFGKWTVLECVGRVSALPKIHYRCRCDCGNEGIVQGAHLRSGASTSCGCERMQHMRDATFIHGRLPVQLYNSWRAMRSRCYDKNDLNYKNYGGRGITVCDKWKNDYITFRDWALVNGWAKDLTIERIDVNGNYTPENCTWIPRCEQGKNTRKTKYFVFIGEKKVLLSDACRIFGINYTGVLKRVRHHAEDVQTAFFHRLQEVYFGEKI